MNEISVAINENGRLYYTEQFVKKLSQQSIEKDKEIDRLNNIIKDLIKDIEIILECEDRDIIKMQLRTCLYNKLKELKEDNK